MKSTPAQNWVYAYLKKHRVQATQLSRACGRCDSYVSSFLYHDKPQPKVVFTLHPVVKFPQRIIDEAHRAQDRSIARIIDDTAQKKPLWPEYVRAAIRNPSPVHWPVVK